MLENRVLRERFGPGKEGITPGWRKLHTRGLYNQSYSTHVITMIKQVKTEMHEARSAHWTDEKLHAGF
jgi:hypothetical protein